MHFAISQVYGKWNGKQFFCYENGWNIMRFQLNKIIQPKLDTDPYR